MTTTGLGEGDPASRALRFSEARYRRLFETARDGILLLNATTAQIEDVNPYLCELLEYSHVEMLGKKLWEVGPFEDVGSSQEMFAVLQERGFVRYQDLPLKTRSGRRISVEFVSSSYDCEGIRVIQCNVRDMTAHHEAELALRRFKAIVDDSDDAIVSKSMDGTITSWNAGAERLFGFSAAEAIGQSLTIIIPADRLQEEADILASLFRGERIDHFETVRRHKNGQFIDISATISPVRGQQNVVVGASKIARGIGARKLAETTRLSLETQLQESQKMEAIGTLAGGVAHDFNNILAIILGNAELALADTRDNPNLRTSIDEIRKAACRARDLVRQILSFSRRQPTERRRTALGTVVEESVRLMRAAFPARVQIVMEVEPQMPDIFADATLVQQVLLNLGTNAMQAAVGGRMTIAIRLDLVGSAAAAPSGRPATGARLPRPPSTVRLSVSDDGPGMDEATVARIFDPFFTTKAIGEGTGLGLSVVRGIVQAHDGVINVESTPGQGTTFSIFLPVMAAAIPLPAAQELPSSTLEPAVLDEPRRLLYVDDDQSLGLLVKRMLERRGYEVVAFADAVEAMEQLRRDPAAFDLVISDYNMPQMSGLDVARAVRLLRPDLPVAVVSGFIDERLLTEAPAAGVVELLVKAADPSAFCEAIARLGAAPRA